MLVEDRATRFVFLGDYIDRGPDSKGVIEYLLEFKQRHSQVYTLMGNHELMLLYYLQGYDTAVFLNVGGQETLESYSIDAEDAPKRVKDLLPKEHLHFFTHLPLLWEDQHGIYVHAGVDSDVDLSRQVRSYCLWVRDEFIRTRSRFTKPVIFGHTTFQDPFVQQDKIGIDTGAVHGGRLTALLLPEKEFVSVTGESSTALKYPIRFADPKDLVQRGTFGAGLRKLFRFVS
ncbi:MAG: serine/threonine protein phosphatase [Candidatus Electrothrix sp. AR3]|nr:serine/threonine protein phosphatase [Candidatus Electrothrix sp. AR3]